uniref:Uncharacterized protein n=1 Tax=Candidatus Berkiella cookevillensis TaxID=437022 RepID=A0A0Q9YHN5_9GAMM
MQEGFMQESLSPLSSYLLTLTHADEATNSQNGSTRYTHLVLQARTYLSMSIMRISIPLFEGGRALISAQGRFMLGI